ncbi:unnamed protein product [Blepharisma stoltei]|uniref:Transcription factor CBF/NF-Y/archaeal histone domain-containing protein n=1 Tax=Blepharisma stoltei TaxID=1481888 RepID=A0AAU9ISD6_9CILI|nr:unnamed protein product [Blepharisma stoltei]
MKNRNNLTFPPNRIKKIVQSNQDIGKLSATTPFLICKITEEVIQQLTSLSSKLAVQQGDSKITLWHLAQVIENDKMFEAIRSKCLQNPMLMGAEPPKKPSDKKKKPKGDIQEFIQEDE